MGEKTGISWTDSTFNPWWGCTKVSPGCDNCYAETFDKRIGGEHWGKGKDRRVFGDKHWNLPLKWDREAMRAGVKTKVFCASMADVMDDEAPEGHRERLWELIDNTPNLIWQLLTKRPHRYATYLPKNGFKHRNVWLGTTCENQDFYDIRWPILRAATDALGLISWISYEPALGPLKLRVLGETMFKVPDWIICGGESGEGRREFKQEWAENLKEECALYRVSFFMKQMGGRTAEVGKALVPVHLLVHQFPG